MLSVRIILLLVSLLNPYIMNKLSYSILFVCLATASAIAQQENAIKINPSIEAVTVFLNGAEIKHSKEVMLKKGSNTIIFQKLSPSMQPQSVQVSVEGDAEVQSVSTESNYLNIEKMEPRIRQLKDSITLFNNKISTVANQVDAYNTEKALLNENRNIGGKQAPSTITDIDKAAEFYRLKTLDIDNSITKLSEELLTLNQQLTLIQSQLQSLNYRNNPERKEVVVVVNSVSDKNITLHLRYIVYNTGWEPAYDLVATDITKPIQLKYKAKVYNNTGINWENVPLTLSTADPSQSASRPYLAAWTLDYNASPGYAEEEDKSAIVNNPEGLLNMESIGNTKGLSDSTSSTVSRGVRYKSIAVAELNTSFPITNPYTIPSDGKPYLVDITAYTLDATYGYVAVPKMDRSAFLVAKISGWERLNLMDGPMNVYFNNAYIGQSNINTRFVEDTLELSLGRDNQILVTRSKKEDLGSKKLIGTSRKESFKYEIVVKNNKTVPINIEIQDQIPVSLESDITVETDDLSGAQLDAPTGKLVWKAGLGAGSATTYKLGFSVKYPKNKAVQVRKFKTISCPSF
jgi:uncharacterized protein (TIGR02231 family)